jgi:putative toxin-antitoxin system antitoxin component (TIGR02293 family)
MATINLLLDNISYDSVDDRDIFTLINAVKRGINYASFKRIADQSLFSMNDWSRFLHISERTLQRYKKEKKTFSLPQSERILEIGLLFKLGADMFGTVEKWNFWLESENLALGNMKPKELLDNTFGINLVKDELLRIGHGVLA